MRYRTRLKEMMSDMGFDSIFMRFSEYLCDTLASNAPIIVYSREELAAFTGCTQSYTMSYLIRPLLLSDALERTDPSSPKNPNQRYVRSVH